MTRPAAAPRALLAAVAALAAAGFAAVTGAAAGVLTQGALVLAVAGAVAGLWHAHRRRGDGGLPS